MATKLQGSALALALGAGLFTVAGPAEARHNDWAAPLVGGALGGYALSSLVDSYRQRSSRPSTTYVEPVRGYVPASSAGPSTRSIEARLQQLDQLAAGGYITKEEYAARREAILNGL